MKKIGKALAEFIRRLLAEDADAALRARTCPWR